MGFSLKESVLKGASEVFSAVVAASLSLLSVLLPVSFIGGFIGRYLQQFSLGLAAAVAFSLLEAVLFLTVRLAYTPESTDPHLGRLLPELDPAPGGDALGTGRRWRKGFGILVGIALAVVASWLVTRHVDLRAGHRRLPARPRASSTTSVRIVLTLPAGPHDHAPRLDRGGPGMGARRLHPRPRQDSSTASVWVLVGAAACSSSAPPSSSFRGCRSTSCPQTDSGVMSVNVRLPTGHAAARRQPGHRPDRGLPPAAARGGDRPDRRSAARGADDRPARARRKEAGRRRLWPRSTGSDLLALFRDQPSAQHLA